MSDAEDRRAADSAAPLDFDLYCLNCGYNLRGLSGDPIRCPECGDSFPRASLREMAEKYIEQRAAGVEAAAYICIVGLVVAVIGLAGFGVYSPAGAALILGGGVIWTIGAIWFRARCGAGASWHVALLHWHVLTSLGVAIGLGLAVGFLVAAVSIPWIDVPSPLLAAAVIGIGLVVMLYLVGAVARFFTRRSWAVLKRVATPVRSSESDT